MIVVERVHGAAHHDQALIPIKRGKHFAAIHSGALNGDSQSDQAVTEPTRAVIRFELHEQHPHRRLPTHYPYTSRLLPVCGIGQGVDNYAWRSKMRDSR